MIKMKKRKNIIIGVFILVMLISITGIYAFDYNEDDDGNPFLESEFSVKAPQITIKELVTLQPSTEPQNPEAGMIYFDVVENRLKLYDGTGWYAFALEKVSTISKQQVKEKVEKKGEVQTCSESTNCGEWGDCINNYQSMICVSVDASCNKYEDTETRDCVSDFQLESSAKESHDVGETTDTITGTTTDSDEETTEGTASETTTSEPQEECSEVCEEVCTDGEETCSEECTEEESCSESCSTDDEGVESCEETCETSESCEEVCEAGEESCEEVCEEVCEVPDELFDITFDLEQNSLSKSDKLVIWVTLQNFGKRYVPARMIYTVTDETGVEVYKKFEEIRVYTDESIIKQFDDMVLEEGDYVLSMSVEYAGIVEEFSDDFSIETGLINAIKRFFSGWF